MAGRNRTAERLVGLALLAVLLFNPPLLSLFSVDTAVFGAPLLFVYIYAAWALIIALIAVTTRRSARHLPGSARAARTEAPPVPEEAD
jgi:hypothetical protein